MNFKVTSRDQYQEMFANKTNPPAVGQYHPNKERFLQAVRNPHLDPEHIAELEATKRKFDLSRQSIKICGHVERTITQGQRRGKLAWKANATDEELQQLQNKENV